MMAELRYVQYVRIHRVSRTWYCVGLFSVTFIRSTRSIHTHTHSLTLAQYLRYVMGSWYPG